MAERAQLAAALRQTLGNLKGPLMKVAQLLATIPDAVPPEYATELAQLQADAPPMSWVFVKRRMAGELGADWQKKFKHFSEHAAHAASLGQVHKAITLAGETVACKLQYPDMASAVASDLQQLKMLFGVFEHFDKAVMTHDVHAEIAARLYEELDYTREATHAKLYAHMLARVDGVHVPTVHDDLSSPRLLTMQWLEGEKFALAIDPRNQAARNQIALNMFKAWYSPLYNFGVIHGDPHMGNYTVRPDNSINLFDFGCVRIFQPKLVAGVIDLYFALHDNDDDKAVAAYQAWGFEKPSKELIDVLNIWARFVYAPILQNKTRPIDETNTGTYGRETAARVHAELRKIGRVKVPRGFVFMDRAAVGLGSVFLRLNANLNWYTMFHELIQGFDVQKLQQKQQKILTSFNLSTSQD